MKKLRYYFGSWEMTWTRVILLAVISAAITALLKVVPFLDDTSFQDPAIYLDCWFVLAILIVVNCKKWHEAALKCFVFFLVSQPLIYLIQVPFYEYHWTIFRYYPRWFFITLLTLPGGAIAFLLKKKNWLSVPVLSVATGYLGFACVNYVKMTVWSFPHHLLSAVFCLTAAVILIVILLDEKKHRIAALAIVGAVMVAAAACLIATAGPTSETLTLEDGSWTCTVEDASVVDVLLEDGEAVVHAKRNGNTLVVFTNADGAEKEYDVTVSGGSLWIFALDDE